MKIWSLEEETKRQANMAKLIVFFTNYLSNTSANNTRTNSIMVVVVLLLLLLLLLLLNHSVNFKEFLPCLIVHT
jgi:asparagine N-glycosylation enzyme membrane subunit Stt3